MNSAIRFFGIAAAAIVLAGTFMFTPGPAAAQKKFVMKFSTATPRGDQNVWMARFKAAVEQRSGGRIDRKRRGRRSARWWRTTRRLGRSRCREVGAGGDRTVSLRHGRL